MKGHDSVSSSVRGSEMMCWCCQISRIPTSGGNEYSRESVDGHSAFASPSPSPSPW